MYRMIFQCCDTEWTLTGEHCQAECKSCGRKSWPAEMYDAVLQWELAGHGKPVKIPEHDSFKAVCALVLTTEATPAGEQIVTPGYAPPSAQERVQLLASLPYSQRKSRAEKARPMDRGLFDVEGRTQLDWLDMIEKLKFDRVETSSLTYAAFIEASGKVWYVADLASIKAPRIAVLTDGEPTSPDQLYAIHDLVQTLYTFFSRRILLRKER